jgi:hypothetical protein
MAAILASCANEQYPAWLWNAQHRTPPAGSSPTGPIVCLQSHAQPLPARLVAMSATASSTGTVVLVSDLFDRFKQVCGACHGPTIDPPGQGGYQITSASDFRTLMTGKELAHVTNATCPADPDGTNPNDPMPPCKSPNGATYAPRSDADPVKQFGVLVQEWLQAGSPASFTPGGAPGPNGGPAKANPYALTPVEGNTMTNIGDCVPSRLVDDQQKMQDLDAKFAAMTRKASGTSTEMIGLPEHLRETDLVSLDSATLAKYGVIAYAPAYPNWWDSAGKLRHVRVPSGKSIHFDKAKQQFDIPPNTRFYETFMKQIVDTDGSYRYRKMETRVIVARPDRNNPDGTAAEQTALFGSYRWTDDESDAVLVQTPLNSGKPFADTLFLYAADEQLAAA